MGLIYTEIIIALISLAGIIITAVITKNQFSAELDKRIALIEQKLDSYGEDIRKHNHYAELFAENIPVIKEQIKILSGRVNQIEKGGK